MENIDAEGLCDDLRMDNIENLKSLEEQMTLSVDNMSGVEVIWTMNFFLNITKLVGSILVLMYDIR